MVDPRNSVNFLAGLLIRKDSCCRQPLKSPAFWNNTPVSDRIDLLALTSDPSRCCGEGTKECWGELSALSPFLSLALFSCDDFIAANGNGSHVFAIIPHIVIMRQSRKAHTHTLEGPCTFYKTFHQTIWFCLLVVYRQRVEFKRK